MDIRHITKTLSFKPKPPLIKINSAPISPEKTDEIETTIEEHTPLAHVPPPSTLSRATSTTAVEDEDNFRATGTFRPAHTHGWKPETMQPPVLLALALASLLLAALLEVLAQKSLTDGALSIVHTADDIPGLVSFGYLYLPTIVAVLYSLAWNWVDLDVKRMQPWLELSREDGTTGRDSLFLDYPVDFVAFVPFKAARRRHWEVFTSGTIVVLVFWILTPMQGAIFGTSSILTSHETNMTYPQDLLNISQQAAMLDQQILNGGYAITWLGQDYPAFTTSQYTLKPFLPPASFAGAAANWSAETTKYWTELDCWPAKATHVVPMPPSVFDFDDGRGCNASSMEIHSGQPDPLTPWKMTYIGWQGSAWADYSLHSPTCGPAAIDEFLATWAVYDNDTATVDVVAAFCEPKYYKQRVAATVKAGSRSPVDAALRPLADPEPLPADEFNRTAFHYLLGAGVSVVEMPRDFPFTSLLSHYYRVEAAGLQYPLTPITALAVGGGNRTAAAYGSVDAMQRSYQAVHQMLFSLAFQHLLREDAGASGRPVLGEAFVVRYGITISRLFSALVEGVLGLVVVMTVALLWKCRRRPSMLSADPSALGSLVKLVEDAPEVQDLFSGTGHMAEDELKKKLGDYQFKLTCGCFHDSKFGTLQVVGKPDFDKGDSDGDDYVAAAATKPQYSPAGFLSPIKPLMLRKISGLIFAILLAGATAVLIFLKVQEKKFGGLSRPSSNTEVNQLLTNYIPMAFSTLVEPLWVLLNRYLCILQPFYELTSAQRSAKRTMATRYTALPPQLTILRALRSGHFLLAAVCITALSANVLSVGLGALFNDLPRNTTRPQTFTPARLPVIPPEGLARFVQDTAVSKPMTYSDPFYVIMANLTYGTALPPWSTAEYSFLPLNITGEAAVDEATVFSARTTGVGVEPHCKAAGVFPSVDQPANISSSLLLPADVRGCAATFSPQSKGFNNTASGRLPDDMPVAAEILDTMTFTYNVSATDCDATLILGWSRSHVENKQRKSQTSYMACSPSLRMADFNVTFNRAGHILSATPVSDFASTWPYTNTSAAAAIPARQPAINSIHYSIRNRGDPWHETALSYDWINYLVVLRSGSRASLDPAAPLPDAAALLPAVESVYKMVFAAYLALNPYLFAENTDGGKTSKVEGSRSLVEARISVSTSALVISVAIMGMYLAMAAAYYGWGVKFFLPRMPSTIGSLLAYVAPSALVREPAGRAYSPETKKYEPRPLIFGRYIGHDGRGQLGISYADRTLPLDLRNLSMGDTRPSKFGILRRRPTERAKNVWL